MAKEIIVWHIDICAIVMEHPRTVKREPVYPHIHMVSFIGHCILNTKILVRFQYGLLNKHYEFKKIISQLVMPKIHFKTI